MHSEEYHDHHTEQRAEAALQPTPAPEGECATCPNCGPVWDHQHDRTCEFSLAEPIAKAMGITVERARRLIGRRVMMRLAAEEQEAPAAPVRAEGITINGLRMGETRHRNPGMIAAWAERMTAEIAAEDAARERE